MTQQEQIEQMIRADQSWIVKLAVALGFSHQEAIEGVEISIAALPVIRQKMAERGLEFRSEAHG